MTTHGLRRVAPILVKRLHEEDESEVRSAISRAVERNQWESVDTPALAQLRTWAETATAHDGERAVAPDGEVRAPSGTGGNPEHRRPAARRTNTYRLVVLTIAWAIFAFETWLYVRSR
jgi:hypothetical protein